MRDRATTIEIDGVGIRVASRSDIIKSKRAAGRPRDQAVLEILEAALEESTKPARAARRTNCLRKRVGVRGSAL